MPETTEIPSLGTELPPEMVQGGEVNMDMPRPDFKKAPNTSQMPKGEMAEQVRRLIMYVGQRGDEKDLEEWVRGLDDDKVIAFTEEYQDNLPFEVLAFLHDVRARVNGQMPELPEDSDVYLQDWIQSYIDAYGLKQEDVVRQGRDAVMEVLDVAFERNGNLTKSERTTVRNMAKNITDERIIQNVMDYAVGHSYVVMCLLRNQNFDIRHINQLVNKVINLRNQDEQREECDGILFEVAGYLASSLHDQVTGRESKGGLKLDEGNLEVAVAVMRNLNMMNASKVYIPQISFALHVLKNPEVTGEYLKEHPDLAKADEAEETPIVVAESSSRRNGDKNNKISEQNAAKKKAATKRSHQAYQPKKRTSTNDAPKKAAKSKGGRVNKPGSVSKKAYKKNKK